MPQPLPELLGRGEALITELNKLNGKIAAVDGQIGRAHQKFEDDRCERDPLVVYPQMVQHQYQNAVTGYIRGAGGPVHAKELFNVAVKNGYRTSGRGNPYYIFCATLRSNKRFVLTGKRMFDLAENQDNEEA